MLYTAHTPAARPVLVEGTVVTFTEAANRLFDVCGMKNWADRRAGTHYVYRGRTESGYQMVLLNTATGRYTYPMDEPFVWGMLRVVGQPG